MPRSFRSPSDVVRRLGWTPVAMRRIRNWPTFMFNYALGLVPPSDYVFRNGARLKIARGVDHAPIVEIFLRGDYGVIPDGAAIVDIGANIGAFTIYAITSARNVKLYAYEPSTVFFNLMEENVRRNGAERAARCFNLAVASTSHPRPLLVRGGNILFPTIVWKDAGRLEDTVQVNCTTLADILNHNDLERVDLLKLDAEGAEYEILYATPGDVFAKIHEIRLEYHQGLRDGEDLTSLIAWLEHVGYDITWTMPMTSTTGTLWAVHHD